MTKTSMKKSNFVLIAIIILYVFACNVDSNKKTETEEESLPSLETADIIVVGAGISGLSAALEAADGGASVLVIEVNSVGGGHAVKATGVAMVGTELQKSKGIHDSPDQAYDDWLNYGETNNKYWLKKYTELSNPMVYEWLTKMGVEFVNIGKGADSKVPRFHTTKGKAVNIVVPMMRKAFAHPNIHFLFNNRVKSIIKNDDAIIGLQIENERTFEKTKVFSKSIILATGGFEGSAELMKDNWSEDINDDNFLIGAGEFATGDGHTLAENAGAYLENQNRHVIFINGIPNPRDSLKTRGLVAGNRLGIWLNDQGQRFTNEWGKPKETDKQVFAQDHSAYWLVFDEKTKRFFDARDAVWLSKESIHAEILENPELVKKASSLQTLADLTMLPVDELDKSIKRYNKFVSEGKDADFGRPLKNGRTLASPPYYAVRMYPLTRKNLGGVAVDSASKVITKNGTSVKGLYAVGELTGMAGINGKHGMSGTFLGPSVLMGRIAAKQAVQELDSISGSFNNLPSDDTTTIADGSTMTNGYWHYTESHRIIKERGLDCNSCHSDFSQVPDLTKTMRISQLNTCTKCH
jgi:flavocytochrome c